VTKEVIATDDSVLYSHSGPVGTSAAALQPEERDEQIQLPYYDSAQDPIVRDSVHCPAVSCETVHKLVRLSLQAFILERAKAFVDLPSIYRRRSIEELDIAEVRRCMLLALIKL